MPKVTIETNFYSLQIYLDGILHFKIKLKDIVAIQSWVNRKNKFIIEYSTATNDIKCEYQDVEVWKEILKQLSNIDFN